MSHKPLMKKIIASINKEGKYKKSPRLKINIDHTPSPDTIQKQIDVSHRAIGHILTDIYIPPKKIERFMEYCILTNIGRMRPSAKARKGYKDILDILYETKTQADREKLIIGPLTNRFSENTEALPPNEAIRAKILKRREKRNKKR